LPGELNHGYDDDRGDYLCVLNDHLGYRFEILGLVGKGSFGQVVKAFDHREGRLVAIKVIRNKSRFHKQALVEVRVLTHIRDHDAHDESSCVRMLEHFTFRGHLWYAAPQNDVMRIP
jgi:dual specificity tyrosine-phosphorylation-regulated kinase 2/3/4